MGSSLGVEVYNLPGARARDSAAGAARRPGAPRRGRRPEARAVRESGLAPRQGKPRAQGARRLQVVERSALVTFSASQMFGLVNDVIRYPEFLPWCVGARVEDVSPSERVASVKVSKGLVRMQFTTRNQLTRDAQILMDLIEGPFSHLAGRWNFDPVGDRGSRVSFRVEFEFKSRVMSAAFSPVFQSVCDSIVDAFVARAQAMYR